MAKRSSFGLRLAMASLRWSLISSFSRYADGGRWWSTRKRRDGSRWALRHRCRPQGGVHGQVEETMSRSPVKPEIAEQSGALGDDLDDARRRRAAGEHLLHRTRGGKAAPGGRRGLVRMWSWRRRQIEAHRPARRRSSRRRRRPCVCACAWLQHAEEALLLVVDQRRRRPGSTRRALDAPARGRSAAAALAQHAQRCRRSAWRSRS